MNRSKIPAVKRNATTQQVMQNAMLRIGKDAETISGVRENALGIFSMTMSKLEGVNAECQKTIEQMDMIIAFAQGQKQDAERMMSDSNAVISKMKEILGE